MSRLGDNVNSTTPATEATKLQPNYNHHQPTIYFIYFLFPLPCTSQPKEGILPPYNPVEVLNRREGPQDTLALLQPLSVALSPCLQPCRRPVSLKSPSTKVSRCRPSRPRPAVLVLGYSPVPRPSPASVRLGLFRIALFPLRIHPAKPQRAISTRAIRAWCGVRTFPSDRSASFSSCSLVQVHLACLLSRRDHQHLPVPVPKTRQDKANSSLLTLHFRSSSPDPAPGIGQKTTTIRATNSGIAVHPLPKHPSRILNWDLTAHGINLTCPPSPRARTSIHPCSLVRLDSRHQPGPRARLVPVPKTNIPTYLFPSFHEHELLYPSLIPQNQTVSRPKVVQLFRPLISISSNIISALSSRAEHPRHCY